MVWNSIEAKERSRNMKHMKIKFRFIAILAILMASCEPITKDAQPAPVEIEFTRYTFPYGQNSLPYRMAKICHNEGAKPILVLYLHGGTSRGDDNEAQLNELAVKEISNYLSTNHISATMIVPQCPSGEGWTGVLATVVNTLMKKYAEDGVHDKSRMYVMGGSMGGTGTWTQLSKFPGFYAAGMPVAGNPTGMIAKNVAQTPVLTVMGTEDKLMSISAVDQFKEEVTASGGTLILDIENGWSHAYTCEHSYTPKRLKWLFSK